MDIATYLVIWGAAVAISLWVGVGALAERYGRSIIGWLVVGLFLGPATYLILWGFGPHEAEQDRRHAHKLELEDELRESWGDHPAPARVEQNPHERKTRAQWERARELEA